MKKGEKTKKLILSKSLQLFSENGFSGSSVRDISSSVGLRESAIYNHFKSKSEILAELIKIHSRESIGISILTDELINQLNKPLKFMQLFSEELINRWSGIDRILFLKLVLKENGREINGEKISIHNYLIEAQKIWFMIFTEMINHKFIKKGDPKIYANEFVAPLFFIRLQFLLDENKIDLKSAIQSMKEHTEYFWESIKR